MLLILAFSVCTIIQINGCISISTSTTGTTNLNGDKEVLCGFSSRDEELTVFELGDYIAAASAFGSRSSFVWVSDIDLDPAIFQLY